MCTIEELSNKVLNVNEKRKRLESIVKSTERLKELYKKLELTPLEYFRYPSELAQSDKAIFLDGLKVRIKNLENARDSAHKELNSYLT